MNICFFNFPEPTGVAVMNGVARATFLLAKELRRRGHSVEFYPPEIPSRRRFHILFVSGFVRSFRSSFRSDGTRFREFLKEHKIDVAVWHGSGSWNFPFSLKNLPCKLVSVCHSSPSYSEQTCANTVMGRLKLRSHFAQKLIQCKPCRFLLKKFFESHHARLFSYTLRISDKFVLLSEGFFSDFASMKKFPEKVCAIPNIAPYEAQSTSFNEKKKELLWVGRIIFYGKRPDFMLHIWQHLQDRFPDWKLRFVGEGDYLPELKKLSTSLGVKNVSFEGFQDPTPYYRSAYIYCLTSTWEGFPMTLLEATSNNCLPIAFESFGAVHDIIENGTNGFLIPPFDVENYAEKLSELMLNPELRKRLATNAQRSIAKFSPETIGDKWEKLLREVVGE